MTTVELGRVIVGATDLAAPPAPRVPIGKVVQGIQHGIAGLDAQVDVLLARKREVDRDVAESLARRPRGPRHRARGRCRPAAADSAQPPPTCPPEDISAARRPATGDSPPASGTGSTNACSNGIPAAVFGNTQRVDPKLAGSQRVSEARPPVVY